MADRWDFAAARDRDLVEPVPALESDEALAARASADPNAKPIFDLLPIVADLVALDEARAGIEELGYEWWDEYGLPGRRYCTLDDPATGRCLIQLHCFAEGSSEMTRHLAFRNYLRAHPEIARAYETDKERCRALHPDDSHAYSDCKGRLSSSSNANRCGTSRNDPMTTNMGSEKVRAGVENRCCRHRASARDSQECREHDRLRSRDCPPACTCSLELNGADTRVNRSLSHRPKSINGEDTRSVR
jgi:hypothetical protein